MGSVRSPHARAGALIDADETVAAPTHGSEPGARADHGRRRWHGSDRLPPPVEVHRRRAGIQPAFSLAVLLAIHQYVNQGVAHRPRGGERPGMVAIPPHGPVPAERAVRRPRHADGKAPDAAAERPLVVGLDDEMEMVILDAELK